MLNRWHSPLYAAHLPVQAFQFRVDADKHGQHKACLTLTCHNVFTLDYLRDQLTPEKQATFNNPALFHNKFTHNNANRTESCIVIYFDDDIDTSTKLIYFIFHTIHAISPLHYTESREQTLCFIKEYCHHRKNHFTFKETPSARPPVKSTTTPESRLLYQAIKERNYAEVKKLLQNNIPAASYFYATPMLTYCLPSVDDREHAAEENILAIFSLMLEYGAPIYGYNCGTLLATLTYHLKDNAENPKQNSIYEKMIRMIMRLDAGKTHQHIDLQPEKENALAKTIMEGQAMVAKDKAFQQTLAFSIFKTPFSQYFKQTQQKPGRIQTLSLKKAFTNAELAANILDLYQTNPEWQASINKETMQKEFQDLVNPHTDTHQIDLIFNAHQTLMGFKIYAIVPAGEQTIFHHIKLMIISSAFNSPGVRHYVALQLAFDLAEEFPNKKIINLFESASVSSYLSVNDYDYFPKTKSLFSYANLLKHTLYQAWSEDLIIDESKQEIRFKDTLALFRNNIPRTAWQSPTQLTAHRLLGSSFFSHAGAELIEGESVVIMMEANAHNKKQYMNNLQQRGFIDSKTIPSASYSL